jgi:hypothetical protein
LRIQFLDGRYQFLERHRAKVAIARCVRCVRLDRLDRLSQIDEAKAEPRVGGLLNGMNIHGQRCDGIGKVSPPPMPWCGLQGIELIQHQRRYGAPNILQIGMSIQSARDFVYFLHGPVFLDTGCVSVNGATTDVILKGY